jgi:two-component sensor histidine kinase
LAPGRAVLIPLGLFVPTCGGAAVLIEALHHANDRYAAALACAEKAERLREALMREMSHRIKNKLQFLAATINLHARTGADVREVGRAAISRIGVIGRVHNTLFDQGGQGTIYAREFITALCADLQATLFGERAVTVRADVDPIMLDLDTATTIGILANELVTNAAKHAFEGRASGQVFVRLNVINGSHCELVVQDDGRGVPEDARQGFGSRIVEILVAQLRGTMQVTNGPGAIFKIRFPLRERAKPSL